MYPATTLNEGVAIMEVQEITRTASNGEVKSSYKVGKLTVHLTSRFNNKIPLEDALYQIILQRLRSSKESEGRQNDDRKFNN